MEIEIFIELCEIIKEMNTFHGDLFEQQIRRNTIEGIAFGLLFGGVVSLFIKSHQQNKLIKTLLK